MVEEHWLNKYWRPAAAYTYLIINIFDFIISPLLNVYFLGHTDRYVQWNPMTLMGAGTFHLAFGSILGVAAWSRGKEKIAQSNIEYETSCNPSRERSRRVPETEEKEL